jgi:hypothetical protein
VVGCVAVVGALVLASASSAVVVFHGSFVVDAADQRVALPDRLVSLPRSGIVDSQARRRLHVFFAFRDGRRGILRQFDAPLAGAAHLRNRNGCNDQFDAKIDASEALVALTTTRSSDCSNGEADFIFPGVVVVSVARYDRAAITVERCSAASQAFLEGEGFTGTISGQLAGNVVAYESCDHRSIIVRDMRTSSSAPAVVSVGRLIGGFAIAGDYLAVESMSGPLAPPTQVSVYRWSDATMLGSFAGSVLIDNFAVDRDGTLATISQPSAARTTTSEGCLTADNHSLAVLSPGQSTPRVLPLTPCAGLLGISDGQILFESPTAPGAPSRFGRSGVVVADVTGSHPRELLSPAMADTSLVDFAPDGQLKFDFAACGDTWEYQFEPFPAMPRPAVGLPRCRAYREGSHAYLRSGVLSVALRCPYGCSGTISLRLAGTGTLLRFTRQPGDQPYTAISYHARTGVEHEAAMLTAASLRRLKPGMKLIASVRVYAAESTSTPAGNYPTAYRTSGVLTVH